MAVFSDLRLLVGLVLIMTLVIGSILPLINLLRGRGPNGRESSVWGRALGGARQAQREQMADYEKLHQMVTSLTPKAEGDDKPHE